MRNPLRVRPFAAISVPDASADLSVAYGAQTWERIEGLFMDAARTGRLPESVDEEARGVIAYFAEKIRRTTESARRGRPARLVATKAAAASAESLRRIAFGLAPDGTGTPPDSREALRNLDAALRRRGRPPRRLDVASPRMRAARRTRVAVELERKAIERARRERELELKKASPRVREKYAELERKAADAFEMAVQRVAKATGQKPATVRRRCYDPTT